MSAETIDTSRIPAELKQLIEDTAAVDKVLTPLVEEWKTQYNGLSLFIGMLAHSIAVAKSVIDQEADAEKKADFAVQFASRNMSAADLILSFVPEVKDEKVTG